MYINCIDLETKTWMECRIWYEKINIIIDNFPIYFLNTFTRSLLTNTERWTRTMMTKISTAIPLLPTTTTGAVNISTATTPTAAVNTLYTHTTAIDTARIHIWLWRTKRKEKCFNQNNFCESTQVTQWICPHKDHDIFPQIDKERKGLKYTVKERRIHNMWRKQIWKDNELDNTVKESLTEERLIQSRKG